MYASPSEVHDPVSGNGRAPVSCHDRQAILAEIQHIVGDRGVLLGADMAAYECGARYGHGIALCVVRPASVDEVSAVVRCCVKHGVPVVPQGANTGLVGASTPDASGAYVVLSLSRLKHVFELDKGNRTVEVSAGVLLQDLNDRLSVDDLCFPIDLGANPSVGGMVAANTGGTRLIRYGDVRHNLLSLEVVLFDPCGTVLRLGRPLRKDNTGPDLKQLFVGVSGMGAIITAATLEVQRRPRQSATALVVPTEPNQVLALLERLEAELGDYVSAFEGISGPAMRAALDHVPTLRDPFAPEPVPEYSVLIELEAQASSQYTQLDLQDALNRFLEDQLEGELISNAVIGDRESLWHIRHSISEGARVLGRPIAFDVSVSRSDVMAFRERALALLAQKYPHLSVVDFGHIADGGMHFNVVWPVEGPRFDPDVVQALRDDLYALIVEGFGGSFSAEHGVGPHNLHYYRRYTPAPLRTLSGALRECLDPQRLCGVVDFGSGQ